MAILVGNKAGTAMERVVLTKPLFKVVVTQPTYDWSTDAITGSCTRMIKAFTSLDDAVKHLLSYSEDESWDNLYNLVMPNGRITGMSELTTFIPYLSGPMPEWLMY